MDPDADAVPESASSVICDCDGDTEQEVDIIEPF